ncbi:MAG: DUF488 domain-containing protein [Deltaproteobacteria bacterium HGW-Deltaproteobacteria-15]|jgi:uncharacterized protein YeaO (DUF488 family)|nr:MAG: DUF488 domain-containing protein [Deltaproteobacteria bacterium HGW-Deltaproteobacteria-15]
MLKIKRAYEKKESTDGRRILIDRLWPRGLTKAEAEIDEWIKELSPSSQLRKWYGHDPEKWAEFKKRYVRELSSADKKDLLDDLAQEASHRNVTLVYGARDTEHSDARVLEGLLKRRMKRQAARP